jgi:predicted esterase
MDSDRVVRMTDAADPHAGQRVVHHGASWTDARLAVIFLHGRGGAPENLLELADLSHLSDVAYLAPAAAGHTWYPESFLAPIEKNEPWLTSALRTVERAVGDIEHHGLSPERIVILGFSQGGCLGLEFAARHARRYAGVVGLSAGLIGPPGTPRAYAGSLEGTPVFLGCSDIDAHIPLSRVHESADVFRRLGALVDERIYPDMGHNVNDDEIEAVRVLLQRR